MTEDLKDNMIDLLIRTIEGMRLQGTKDIFGPFLVHEQTGDVAYIKWNDLYSCLYLAKSKLGVERNARDADMDAQIAAITKKMVEE